MIDHNDEQLMLSRRGLMIGGVAAGAIAALPFAPAMAFDPGAEGLPDDAASRVAIVRRLRYRSDAGTVMWWVRGRTYAQQGATLTPVCGLLFGSMIKLQPRDDGGFDVRQYEVGFRTDLVTGETLERLRNPITGDMIDIPFAPVGPTRLCYSPANVPVVPATVGGSKFTYTHFPEEFWRAGDTVFMQYHSRSVVETPGQANRVSMTWD